MTVSSIIILHKTAKYDGQEHRKQEYVHRNYVMLFFAATGGLLGMVAAAGNRTWISIAVVLFFIMAALAGIQRRVTGM